MKLDIKERIMNTKRKIEEPMKLKNGNQNRIKVRKNTITFKQSKLLETKRNLLKAPKQTIKVTGGLV